jgi:Fur family transcriptional regulator, peroxide stress response regulator
MTIDKKEVEKRVKHFEHVCRSAGLKLTHQRQEIFREVAQSCEHPDADNVFRLVRTRLPTVSLDTVYRTLWLLNDLGLIHTLGSHHTRTRFDANLRRHHHFVCISCGMMEDFYSPEFDSLTIPDSLQSVDTVKDMQVEVRGICNACAAKNKLNRKIKQEDSV